MKGMMTIILHRRRRFNWQVFLMAMLGVAFLLVFAYVPMFGIAIAFKNMDYSMNFMKDLVNKPWVGLENFAKFIHDAQFATVMTNTLMLGILELVCTFPLPILFALLINELRSSAFRRVAQTATYFPHFISWVVYGGIVTAFLSSDGGFINNVLMALGVIQKPVNFMSEANAFASGANKEVYAFLNEAYRRGLVLEANYSDTRDQVREKIASGRVFALIAAPQDFANEFTTLYQQDNNAYYVPVTLRNAAGDDPVLGDISGWGYLQTVISASCKDPEKVIKFISYLVNDEGAIHLNKGWEGEHWNYNDDGTISRTQAYIDAVNADPTYNKKEGISCFDLFANWAFLMQFEPKLDLENPDDLKVYRTADTYIKQPMAIYSHRPAQYKYDPNDDRALAVNEEQVKLKSYMTIAEAELLTASTAEAFEAKYAEIQQALPTVYNMELVLAYTNDALQAGKTQLGVKFFWPPYADAE